MLIEGIHIPLTSPFYRDGRLYLRKLEHNVARYSATPAAGMVAFSSNGEPDALNDAEYADSVQAIAATAAPEKVLVADITRPSVVSTLQRAKLVQAAGFDAVLLGAPTIWAELVGENDDAQLLGYFRVVADACALPVLLSSAAGEPGLQLSVKAVGALARHPNIIGLYDAALTVDRLRALQEATREHRREVIVTPTFAPVTGRMQRAQAATTQGAGTFVSAETLTGGVALATAPPAPALKTRTKVVGFQVIAAGSMLGSIELLETGAAGIVPALAACAPQGCFESYAAYRDNDVPLAAEKLHRLTAAEELLRQKGIAAIKHGCDYNGYYGGSPRLPRLPLTLMERKTVEETLAETRN